MRLGHLPQVARVAIVMPPAVRMGSVGVLVDCLEMTRAQVRRQYGAVDVLSAADRFGVVEVVLLAIGSASVRTEGGTVIAAAASLREERFDVVVIADHAPGEDLLGGADAVSFAAWLTARRLEGSALAACGAGVGLLAASGQLDGNRAAAPRWLRDRLARRWPRVRFESDTDLVEDGTVLTGTGGEADIRLAVRLVEAIASPNMARWLAEHMGIAEPSRGERTPDTLIARAQDWIAERYSQKIGIAELADALGVSRRTLHRHFLAEFGAGPADYLQSVRIEASKRMLERAPFSVERIAALVGYGDPGAYREAFRQRTGVSPRAWRSRSRLVGG